MSVRTVDAESLHFMLTLHCQAMHNILAFA